MGFFFRSPVWKLFLGHKNSNCKFLALIFVFDLFVAFLEGGSFAFIYQGFSALESKGAESFPLLSYFDPSSFGFALTQMQLFCYYVLLAVGFQVFRGACGFLASYGNSLFSLHVQTKAQQQVFLHIFRFSFPFVSRYKIGDLSEYAKIPSVIVPSLFGNLNDLCISAFMCLGLMGMLFWISPMLALLTLTLFFLFALSQKSIVKKVTFYSLKLTGSLFELNHQTTQLLQGLRPIHLFQRKNFILKKIDLVLKDIFQSSRKANFWNNLIPSINETVNVLLVGAILILGSILLVRSGETALSSLLTYIALTYRLATRMQIFMRSVGTIGLHYGPLARLNDFLEEDGKEFDSSGVLELKGWETGIAFRSVSFQYPKTKMPALENVTFSIPKGGSTAIIGLSGAGKSSLLDLILGLYQPSFGEILVDSQPLSSYSHESWRKRIGIVSQDTFIFNGTIEENIRFGHLEADFQQVREAATFAGAAEFIEQLHDGYETCVGERGHKLSGGERQRLALARALLRNPEILVLDEATSNLDSYSEHRIQQSLESLDKTKTLIIVAHRLSTIIKADQIIVLEQGKIIERGTHEALLLQNGRYAKLWRLQSGELVLKSGETRSL